SHHRRPLAACPRRSAGRRRASPQQAAQAGIAARADHAVACATRGGGGKLSAPALAGEGDHAKHGGGGAGLNPSSCPQARSKLQSLKWPVGANEAQSQSPPPPRFARSPSPVCTGEEEICGHCPASIRPAAITACVRLSTPSFCKIAETCAFTVASDTPSSKA